MSRCFDVGDGCRKCGLYDCCPEAIAYQQGRQYGIDEFCTYVDKHSHIAEDGMEICLDDDITILAEQLKEQKE